VGVDKNLTALYRIQELDLTHECGWKLPREVLWCSMSYCLYFSLLSFLLFLVTIPFFLTYTVPFNFLYGTTQVLHFLLWIISFLSRMLRLYRSNVSYLPLYAL